MIEFVASKLKGKDNVAEAFIRQGEKEDDGMINEGQVIDLI